MSVKAVRVKDIMGVMEKIAPKKLAENWDKPGLAIGDPEREVEKILVALDVIDPRCGGSKAHRRGHDCDASPDAAVPQNRKHYGGYPSGGNAFLI